MSIISSEIEAQKRRDPSYIDSDLQWAWGRGYKAGASREITEEEYERIDNIEDVREGDEVFTLSGNKYQARSVYESREVYVDGDGFSPIIQRKYFAYALHRKPKLPDHDGLWWDKDNALWSVAISGLDNSKLVALLIGDPESPVTGSVWSGLNSKHVTSQAPFRPAKAVEA